MIRNYVCIINIYVLQIKDVPLLFLIWPYLAVPEYHFFAGSVPLGG